MAKPKSADKPNETSLERTARLARKLLGVPKREVDKEQTKYDRAKEQRSRQS